jgi:hypothetical protein
MATKKNGSSKKGRLRDLAKPKKRLTAKKAKSVKGGISVRGKDFKFDF